MTASISSSKSCCKYSWVLMVWCWCEGEDTVFGAEVFMASTSVWVVRCSIGSAVVAWRFVDGCGWSVCSMCVVWMVV
jgi:hypothetical protein